ncbi:MAG: peptidylprolyl isomerase, partial [Azoarcus sp.]|nr:peptidylprolyl isomerase [Azoarcus sp.]
MKLSLNKLNVALAVATITLVACAGDPGQTSTSMPTGNAIAVVNGVSIPETFADVIIAEQRAKGATDDQNLKNNIRKDLIRRELLVQAATTVGIDKRADTLAKQNLARQNVLIGDYVQDWIKNNPPTDDEIKQEYDSIKAKLGAQKEYHARHVLVKT